MCQKRFTVQVWEVHHFWDLLEVEATSPEEAESIAENLFESSSCENATIDMDLMVLTEDGKPLPPSVDNGDTAPACPAAAREAVQRILDYLWADGLADYLETSPLEGREDHIFNALSTVRRWLAGKEV